MFTHSAFQIEKLNKQRLASQSDVTEAQETARWHLALAELKAKQVDSKEKLFVAAVSVFAYDLCFKGLSKSGLKVLGLKLPPGVESTAKLSTMSVTGATGQRMLATFYMTLLQGAALSTDIVMNHTGKVDGNLVKKIFMTTGQTGLVLGLRSAFPSGNWQWVGASLSGFTMRWRKMSIDSALGFDNGGTVHQLANMTVGALSMAAQVYFIRKGSGPGIPGAIGGIGMLLGDIISGRGTPGMIVGSTIEIGANLFVKSPFLRPFAIPTARTLNALIVLLEAQSYIDVASNTLTQAQEIRNHQIALRDATLWLARANGEAFAKLTPPEKDFVLSTAVHPFDTLTQHYNSL